MLNKVILLPAVAVVAALLMPSQVDAYGAAHVGYTHVGPEGVQHYGATAARGPEGAYGGAHESAYGAGGGAYHAGYGGATTGGAAGGYHYDYRYSGGAATGGAEAAHYGYVR
jgi:hypothetical protein